LTRSGIEHGGDADPAKASGAGGVEMPRSKFSFDRTVAGTTT
jgi:hypothetical protein